MQCPISHTFLRALLYEYVSETPPPLSTENNLTSVKHVFESIWTVHFSEHCLVNRTLSDRVCACACMLVTQSYPTLCYPTDCSPPGLSVHGILQARILENSLLQRNFPTQGSNCGLLYCRQILYHLSSWEVFFFLYMGFLSLWWLRQ